MADLSRRFRPLRDVAGRPRTARPPRRPRLSRVASALALSLGLALTAGAVGAARAQDAARPVPATDMPGAEPDAEPGGVRLPAACRNEASLIPRLRANGEWAAAERAAATVVNGDHRFFSLSGRGTEPSYLFGTMHSAHPEAVAIPAPVAAALADADRLVVESVEALDPARAAGAIFAEPQRTSLGDGRTLDDLLAGSERAQVSRALAEAGAPYAAMKGLKPWIATMALVATPCEQGLGAAGEPILDARLAGIAERRGIPVEGLETIGEQLDAIGSMPLDAQVESLVAAATHRDRLPDLMATMRALYAEGRIGLIMPVLQTALPEAGLLVGGGEGGAAFEARVIDARNATMAERLTPFLRAGGAFVAVGALHLPGEEGLVARLRERGWTVEPVAIE